MDYSDSGVAISTLIPSTETAVKQTYTCQKTLPISDHGTSHESCGTVVSMAQLRDLTLTPENETRVFFVQCTLKGELI